MYDNKLVLVERTIFILDRLFSKIPENLFSPLSRKYKAVYAFALLALYQMLKTYKSDIKRSDYSNFLKSQGEEILSLFSVESDRLDDKDDEETVYVEKSKSTEEDQSILNDKVSYIIRKLSQCGWFIVSKDPKSNVEYLYIPAYSIKLIKLIYELSSDIGTYLPLVHQTYSELKLEDEKEDEYMYRALINAKNNADSLEMSVTLLRQQIFVFGNKLTNVLDPNVALKQHFDEYRVDVSEKYYHPMKTYDSLGLYSQPTIAILNKWLRTERIMNTIVKQAKAEPVNRQKSTSDMASEVIKLIQGIIDIFSHISSQFTEIDRANADYTEAVQKKINYLSSTDKTIKGKIDKIIWKMASEIKDNPTLDYDQLPTLQMATDSIRLMRQGCIDSQSMMMPYKRGAVETDFEPLTLDDDLFPEEQADLINSSLSSEVTKFSDAAVIKFLNENFKDKSELLTNEIEVDDLDKLVLMIFSIIKCTLDIIPFKCEKIEDSVKWNHYLIPLYKITRKGGKKNVSRGV